MNRILIKIVNKGWCFSSSHFAHSKTSQAESSVYSSIKRWYFYGSLGRARGFGRISNSTDWCSQAKLFRIRINIEILKFECISLSWRGMPCRHRVVRRWPRWLVKFHIRELNPIVHRLNHFVKYPFNWWKTWDYQIFLNFFNPLV